MGIIRNVIGEGLIGVGKLVGYLLVLFAVLSFFVGVSQDNPVGYVIAVIALVIGVGLMRYE